MVSPLGRTLDRGSEVRRRAHLLEHDVERGVAVESLDLAVPHVEEVRARDVDLCSWITPADVSIGRERFLEWTAEWRRHRP